MNISRFENAEKLAEAAAVDWLDALAAAGTARPFCVALSGGRIAAVFFRKVVEIARQRRLTLGQVEFFWADERCVPPTDPESNFKLAQDNLFTPLAIDPRRVHRIPGELEMDAAAARAESEFRRVAPSNNQGIPVVDLAFLGMGEDGHVASLFPGGPLDAFSSERVFQGVIGPKPPPQRVTMTYSVLAAALDAWVLVSGPGKAQALASSVSGSAETPLGRLLAMRTRTRILADLPV